MDSDVQVALIITIPPILTVIASLVVQLRVAALADKRMTKALGKADEKLDHITVLTNSTLTEAKEHIAELQTEVRGLIAEREKRAKP